MNKSIFGKLMSFVLALIMSVGTFFVADTTVSARGTAGIKNNGTDGIYINIYGAPYSTFATSSSWGQYAYGPSGCAWFASARVREITGKGSTIWSGQSWYSNGSQLGFSRGKSIRAKGILCFTNHVAIAERVNGDSVLVSEGGHTSYPGNDYCAITYQSKSKIEARSDYLGCVYIGDDIVNFSLNVKVNVDGVEKSNFDGIGTFDVYINGVKKNDNISGYNVQHAKGTSYEINDIKTYGCFVNVGVPSISGTLNSNTTAKFTIETKHTLNDGVITTQPSCTEKGVKTISCENCDYTSTAGVEALGHDYKETRIDPTCTENAKYVSICSRCNDSTVRPVTDEDIWSEWSEVKPDVDESRIQTKTQYRYMQSETKLSPDAELAGWVQVGKAWGEGKQSTVSYVASFPAGFSKSNALYNQYNKTAPVSYENETTKVEVGSATTTGYIYWHWCSSSYNGNSPINRLINDSYTSWDSASKRPYDVFHAFYSTEYRGITASAGAVNFSNSGACNQTYWWHSAIPVVSVPVTTYDMMYEYTRDTEWGEWTDNAFSVTDDAKFETRTLYRYSDSSDLATGHKWDNGVVDGNVKKYTCTKCSETKTEDFDAPDVVPGDVNKDGKVTAADARFALRISAKLETPDDAQFLAADVNKDNRVSAADARIILRVSAKIETL